MTRYTMRRVVMVLITILVITCVTLVLMMPVSGNPFNDEKITPEQEAAMETKYGVDDPLGIQILRYFKGVIVSQDFGVSLKIQKDRLVLDIITEKFPLPAEIGIITLVWTATVGIPLDCLAAYSRRRWVDSVLWVVCALGVSMSGFVVATFLLILFRSDRTPPKSMGISAIFDALQGTGAYLIPCLALGLYPMCYIAHLARFSMLDALDQDYIETARAKGLLTPRIIFKHVLRSGIAPVITYLGPLTTFTPVGGFVVKTAYTIPGLGHYLVQSVQNRDYFIIMGTTISLTALTVVMDLMVDILYRVTDPRIDLTKGG